MVVCAYVLMAWVIGLALVQIVFEFRKFEASVINVLHSLALIVLSILGIIGVANI